MGLFSSVANILSAPGKRKAASNAAAWQQAGLQDYINTINGVQDKNDALFSPYVDNGAAASGAQADLLGLNGNDASGAAISALQGSPLYESLFRNGQNTVLANGAATGGLRGGNMQSSLANFGSDTLAKVIQQQLANLGGVSAQGLSATGTMTAQDNDTANTVGNLRSGISQSKGGLALAKNAITNQQYSDIAGLAGELAGAYFGVPGLGGTSGGSGGGLDLASLLGFSGAGGSGGSASSAYTIPTSVADSANPFSISSDTSSALGGYQRSQGGGIANSLSSFLSRLQF